VAMLLRFCKKRTREPLGYRSRRDRGHWVVPLSEEVPLELKCGFCSVLSGAITILQVSVDRISERDLHP